MECSNCGDDATIQRMFCELCQFCWDCLWHELKIRLDAIRDFGQYHHGNCGPNFLAIYWNGKNTLGYGLHLPRTPEQAMSAARRIAARNNWRLLRLDIQKTLVDVFVSADYNKYFKYGYKDAKETPNAKP